jgi:hypothetical protein
MECEFSFQSRVSRNVFIDLMVVFVVVCGLCLLVCLFKGFVEVGIFFL